ncbi:MAG: hypothetical protein H7A51_14280 [Akkermansiaceae bacterium]|nr:hypothetical protein [Akkermansiaceae bacterium]
MTVPFKIPLLSLVAVWMMHPAVNADWRTEIGWDKLQLYAGAGIPTGSNLYLEMTEAGTDYMPNTGTGAFSGITFTNISNTSSNFSGHATTVGLNYYGSTTSLLTGASSVGVRSADDFLNNFLKTSGSVGTSSAAVMSHAYIAAANALQETSFNELIKRFDFFSQDSGVINVVGMNNGSSGTIPPIFGSAYNAISVGRTDGLHSHGTTPANYPGPGRQKPEIVSVSSTIATSYATGAVSSAAALLYAKAALASNADATHPDTIKACLMTGATKEEFPNWSQTSTAPLDTTYGAGELNIFHSYRIIENAESAPGTVNFRGWSRNNASTSQSVTYTFTTPDYSSPITLSSTLVWQRGVRKIGSLYTYRTLADLRLELLNQSGTLIQSSDSTLDNIEHLWNTGLSPNTTYSLKVTSNSGSADFSLAWRVNGIATAVISSVANGNDVDLSMSQLLASVAYTVQRSTDLAGWSDVHSFTATGTTHSWTDTTVPTGTRVFYRLRFFEP